MKHCDQLVRDWQKGGFGLYIHWPFCQSKCPYCDFNSHAAGQIDHHRWQAAYLTEIERVGTETSERVLQSIFFGGGTPSLMKPEIVAEIISKARSTWSMSNDIEITMEANPSSVEAGRFRAYRDAGVNRVSVGIQALNDIDLRALGRLHSVAEAKAALVIAKSTFQRVSFDLIYARQRQTLADWRAELNEAFDIADGHLSLYQLSIEDGTVFGERHRRGLLRQLPDEDLAADMYMLTQEATEKAGYLGYEVSNYAITGQESRHNCIYWNAGDYAGIGPGAHGRLSLNDLRYATEAITDPTKWLLGIETQVPVEERQVISRRDQGTEYLLMGLRRITGIDLARLAAISDARIPDARIDEMVSLGMLSRTGSQLAATAKGRIVLNAIIDRLTD